MVYQYFIKDHLGNTRIMFDEGGVKQSINYYPFGMRTAVINQSIFDYNNTKYLYNGKELQDDFDLDWYDYGARFYDAQLGRWHVIDPMAHLRTWVSPYNFVQNNPIMRTDPTGALDTKYEDEAENTLAETDDGSTDVVTITHDKLAGFNASFKSTSEEARNSTEMNNIWKNYSGNNIKSDKLDPSTLGRNIGGTNYIGKHNPQTYPDAKDNRKWDYSASPVNFADFAAFLHDKSYDNVGAEGINGVLFDTKAIGADWRFVGNQIVMGKAALMMGDFNSAKLSYGTALGMGLGVTGKTLFQISKPTTGAFEILMWDKISQPTK